MQFPGHIFFPCDLPEASSREFRTDAESYHILEDVVVPKPIWVHLPLVNVSNPPKIRAILMVDMGRKHGCKSVKSDGITPTKQNANLMAYIENRYVRG
jgi:hypothetical protein